MTPNEIDSYKKCFRVDLPCLTNSQQHYTLVVVNVPYHFHLILTDICRNMICTHKS